MGWRVICWHYVWCKFYLKLLEPNLYIRCMHICAHGCASNPRSFIKKLRFWLSDIPGNSSGRKAHLIGVTPWDRHRLPPSFKGLFDPEKVLTRSIWHALPCQHSSMWQALASSDFWSAFQRSHYVLITICCVTQRLLAITILVCFSNLIPMGYHVLNLNMNWLDLSDPIQLCQPHGLHVWTSIGPSRHCLTGLALAVFTDACRTDQWVGSRGWTGSWVNGLGHGKLTEIKICINDQRFHMWSYIAFRLQTDTLTDLLVI